MLLSHHTITVSHFDMLLSPLGLYSTTVHNGIGRIPLLPREDARAEICVRAKVDEDSFIVGTIAELHMNKGIDVLIQAAYLVPEVQVIVIGEGEERPALERLIKELGLDERVHLIGFIDEASRYLKAFDTFVLPSRKEGLPYAILEAGAAEVPVIASAVGGIPEIVNDQLSGDLVHAFNDEALAESIREFRDSPNTRRHYAEMLKTRIERYFGLDDMVKKTVEVYEQS
jgi:glycosyltransferase involved in cell wall biosynthesis